jgi:glycosyltransferase involved in cell wall biosynthesis
MISIIIPTYNRKSVLEKTLPSYLEQMNIKEIIIVDDGSTDSTSTLIQEYLSLDERIKYIRLDTHSGAPFARLTGIKNATGEYILFGEDDVEFDPNYSYNLLRCLYNNCADIVAGRIIYLKNDEHYNDALTRCDKLKDELINWNTLGGNFQITVPKATEVPFVHACFLIKRDIYSKIQYDINYFGNGYREETDPQISALKQGAKIYFCPQAICYHLPRDITLQGGQRTMNYVEYNYWMFKNNTYFLNKHYSFLKERYGLKPKTFLMLSLLIERMKIITLSPIKYLRSLYS